GARERFLAPLRIPSFRWFLASTTGQMASLNMQGLVRGFLTFELTESFAALGTLFLINSIPGMLFALWGGVLADRIQRRKRIVQTGQLINALNATIVGLMLVTDVLRFEHLLIAAFLQGTVNSVMMPARQAMLPGVVGLPNLTSAVAVNAAARDSIRLLAPAVGGFLIHILGAYWVYFLMAGTYLFASATLIPVRSSDDTARRRASGGWRDIVEGIRYIYRDDTLRPLLSFNILFAILAMPYIFMLPGYVADVFEDGADRLGLLLSFIGAGALCGALIVATLGPNHRGKTLLLAVTIQGLALIAFATTKSFWIAAPIAVVIGLSEALRMSLSNVLVQTYVQDEFRGRVMSAYMLQRALAQFGAFFAGLLAAVIGVQLVLGGMAALLVLVATAVLAFHQRLRTLA
ncbi:MAG: MFS transporter, partial [Dehalococcoidia bacterium]|nr:MFS transporter [Dehalococcoidia bacterium]